MCETEIIQAAKAALKAETGLDIEILEREFVVGKEGLVDALIRIGGEARKPLMAEVKKWTSHAHTGVIIDQLARLGRPEETILIADYINPRMAERLREADIQFMDSMGNTHVRQDDLFVFITGKRKGHDTAHDQPAGKPGKAFQFAGMKVTYLLLTRPTLVNAPYRQLAKKAQVALGNIGAVLKDLEEQGYLDRKTRNRKREIANFEGLLDKWVKEYPVKLLPKIELGTFVATGDDWRQEVKLEKWGALWGGEQAATRYTKLLKPKDVIIYVGKAQLTPLVKQARLRKYVPRQDRGLEAIRMHDVFWEADVEPKNREVDCTDWVLTYADLMATGDARNVETAHQIRRDFDQRYG